MIGVIIVTSLIVSSLYGTTTYCICKSLMKKRERESCDEEEVSEFIL